MPAPLDFGYNTGISLQSTLRDLMFHFAISKCFVLKLKVFYLSLLIFVPSGLRKAYPGALDLLSELVLFQIPFCDPKFVNTVRLFQKIR